MKSVLIGTPIQQDKEILHFYLQSLEKIKKDGLNVHYYFVDDNRCEESAKLLQNFQKENPNTTVVKSTFDDEHIKTEEGHEWKNELIWKVADFKNNIIEYALKEKFDYLFFVDSDLVLHHDTLQKLIEADKEIVSEVFWTQWTTDSIPLPQVWVKDQYTLYHSKKEEKLTEEEKTKRTHEFLQMLKKPGVYEVGGLGALTLISRKALEAGVNFKEISNISYHGEDRHFCIRAIALGFSLYVDTHYPALHLYRKSDLDILR